MSNPTVCAIMLTRDRPEMSRSAVLGFRGQNYDSALRYLLILDSGDMSWYDPASDTENEVHVEFGPYRAAAAKFPNQATIGALRNHANRMTRGDIIAHWDSDDWSHPNRLTEQVALLEASGAECVGYNSMLFWDSTKCQIEVDPSKRGPDGEGCLGTVKSVGEAWLYRAINPKHILGTSLMYWRSTWERQPFDDIPTGEDTRFVKKLKACGVSSIPAGNPSRGCHDYQGKGIGGSCADDAGGRWVCTAGPCAEPRMVASVHGANSSGYEPEKDRTSTRRVPEWDSYCKKVMQL